MTHERFEEICYQHGAYHVCSQWARFNRSCVHPMIRWNGGIPTLHQPRNPVSPTARKATAAWEEIQKELTK